MQHEENMKKLMDQIVQEQKVMQSYVPLKQKNLKAFGC